MVTKSGGFAWEVLHVCLVPRLVPLGSTWTHVAENVLFAAFGLGSCLDPLGSTWIHVAQNVLFATFGLGSCLVLLSSKWIHAVIMHEFSAL